MMLRYFIAVWLAALVTFGLFVMMERLVAVTDMRLNEASARRAIDFVRLKRESATEVKKRELPTRTTPKEQPRAPSMDLPSSTAPTGQAITVQAPQIDQRVDLAGGLHLGGAPSDTEAVPVVRIEPVYPRAAAQRQIEGWVLVEFTISVTGSVKNPVVIAAEPPGIFDRAAITAISKWKYKPKVDEGKALETRGVKVRLRFELDQ